MNTRKCMANPESAWQVHGKCIATTRRIVREIKAQLDGVHSSAWQQHIYSVWKERERRERRVRETTNRVRYALPCTHALGRRGAAS